MARAARKRGIDRGFEIAGAVWAHPFAARARGGLVALSGAALAAALATWKASDPSLNASAAALPGNVLGGPGAVVSDLLFQALGLPAALVALLM
jgi:S-DNA-T family DNA segregation ATPase FtsK/SpoIIIE